MKNMQSPQENVERIQKWRSALLETLSKAVTALDTGVCNDKRLTKEQLGELARVKEYIAEVIHAGGLWADVATIVPYFTGLQLALGYMKTACDVLNRFARIEGGNGVDELLLPPQPKGVKIIEPSKCEKILEKWLSFDLIWCEAAAASCFNGVREIIMLYNWYNKRIYDREFIYSDDSIFRALTNSVIYAINASYYACREHLMNIGSNEVSENAKSLLDYIVETGEFNILEVQKRFFKRPSTYMEVITICFYFERLGIVEAAVGWEPCKVLVRSRTEAISLIKKNSDELKKKVKQIEREII